MPGAPAEPWQKERVDRRHRTGPDDGSARRITLAADRPRIEASGQDLSFIKVAVVDKEGRVCPQPIRRSASRSTARWRGWPVSTTATPLTTRLFRVPATGSSTAWVWLFCNRVMIPSAPPR